MENSREEILKVKHLKKYFNTPAGILSAVDDINFSIKKGETLGVVGESGCGKSTLGKSILRLEEPTSGDVYFNGKNVTKMDKRELKQIRKDMQIIFQDPYESLNPRMTVSQLIQAPMIIQGIYKKSQREEMNKKTLEIMEQVGLARRLVNTYPHELDGGREKAADWHSQSPGAAAKIHCL